MSSILTNTSAMVALQTLNSINKNLATVQSEISTGKSVASAKDNSAVWAISQVMQSDVDGFNAISDTLSLGQSTVAVGRNAAESVTSLLSQVKEKIVAAQEDNVDRGKLQTDLSSLRDQISGIVGAAQFNGQNLLSNTSTTAGEDVVDILASLDRASDGSVTSSNITVSKQDLGTGASAKGTGGTGAAAGTVTSGTAIGQVSTLAVGAITTADAFEFDMTTVGGTGTAMYVAREGDTAADVAKGIVDAAKFSMASAGLDESTTFSFAVNAANEVEITNNTGATQTAFVAAAWDNTASGVGAAANTIGGGLDILGKLDISTANGAAAALSAIEGLTQTAISAAAEFGTGEKRLEIQADFVSKLTDSLKAGIGALVDANMEEASAKLQALQVQQQLGVQSLSIANQAPQSVLSLFR